MAGMSRIVLATLNARYIHSSIGLRYLLANLGESRTDASILEFVVADRPADMAEKILAADPLIVGLGVYIWNARETAELIRVLKAIRPDLIVVLGGPELNQPAQADPYPLADYIVMGEGETAFSELCRELLAGQRPGRRLIQAAAPDLTRLELPYEYYDETDVKNRVVYLEASRGCPFGCEFCLSSIERRVRYFDTGRILAAVDGLWRRGVRHFKFVDRSFNLDENRAVAILDDFLVRTEPYLLHFEMVPELLPPLLRDRLRRFSPGRLQLELGIQTLNPEVAARIGRPLDMNRITENLAFLSRNTAVHLHADLIFGLPGESLDSMAAGLDRLMVMSRGEIQLGILKKLSGTAIARHDGPFAMVFSPLPPYELLASGLLPFPLLQRLKRMARFWDLCHNSGRFRNLLPLLWPDGRVFTAFLSFSDWLFENLGVTSAIAADRLLANLQLYLNRDLGVEPGRIEAARCRDQADSANRVRGQAERRLPRRQGRHHR